jgi:hypothetical protein
MHPDIEQDLWADEIEHDEEPKRFARRAPDEDPEKEMSLWSSLD